MRFRDGGTSSLSKKEEEPKELRNGCSDGGDLFRYKLHGYEDLVGRLDLVDGVSSRSL